MSERAIELIAENKNTKATSIDLSYCDLVTLPLVLGDCIWLKELILTGNKELRDLSSLSALSNLEILYCPLTQISNLSPISELINLKILYCSSTPISDLSPLYKLVNLEQLFCYSTQVSDLSPLSGIASLRQLFCSNTPVSDLSPLYRLVNLKHLFCYFTQVSDLSPLSELLNLQKLSVYSTLVKDLSPLVPLIKKGIPVSMTTSGNGILVQGCPITTPPIEIIEQGRDSILRYFDEREKAGTDQILEAKLLLIGEGGAGKTSLCRKLFDVEAELPKEKDSTQGIDIKPLYFELSDNKKFRLNVWDFAGQGKYQSAHSFFYTHRSLYVFVDDTRTLDENEAYRTFYNYWLQTAELFGGNSPLLILHNQKADRVRTGFNLGSFQAAFPFIKELFCINLGGKDSEEIIDIKKQIERWAQKLPHIGDVVPKTWVKVREDIETERQSWPYISAERYREICESHGITDDLKQSDLSHYFHDLGVFLHFQNHPLLRRDVFLQNEWVTNAVYKILDDNEIALKKRGRFEKTDLARLWNEGFYRNRREELLALMLQFELCYQVQDTEIYVVPQLLPGDIPGYDLGSDIPLQLKYEYGFMPKGLLYRLIVRLHRHIAQQQSAVWNSGMVLEREGTQADVIESLDRRQISVRATGHRAKELVTIINEEVERLHASYGERLKVEVKIPCNCNECSDSNMPNFYDKKDLDNRLAKGKKTVECRMSFEDVKVQVLLDGVFTIIADNNDYIRKLFTSGEIEKALEALQKKSNNPDVVNLLSQFNLAKRERLGGRIDYQEFEKNQNRIIAAALELL